MHLSGACAYKDFLNGLTFVSHGYSANGAMMFKAWDSDQYLYYDLDCDGGSNGQPRWILDYGLPNASLTEDLDMDGACNYHARLDASEFSVTPPREATWTMFCGREWVQQTLAFTETPLLPPGDSAPGGSGFVGFGHEVMPPALRAQGIVCSHQSFLDGMDFIQMGKVASGAPYYKAESAELYIYYDPDCRGSNDTSRAVARWIIDEDAPNVDVPEDLDEDGECNYIGRALYSDDQSPPKETMWRLHCGDGAWEDYWMTLRAIPSPTTTETSTTRTTPRTTAAPDPTTSWQAGDLTSDSRAAGGLGRGTTAAVVAASVSLFLSLSADLAGSTMCV